MSSVRVYIGTTEGPSEVQRIKEEDPDVRCVVCLNKEIDDLPISLDYNRFVKSPTGVIEHLFGYSSYRIDVSAPILEGRSWQVGFLAAHALYAGKRLATRDDDTREAIWLTGRIDDDLRVTSVESVQKKLELSGELFGRLKAEGIQVTIYLPTENFSELDLAWFQQQGYPDIIPMASAHDLFRALHIQNLHPSQHSKKIGLHKMRLRPALVSGGVVAILILLAAAGWRGGADEWYGVVNAGNFQEIDAKFEKIESGTCIPCKIVAQGAALYLTQRRPSEMDLLLVAIEQRDPSWRNCMESGVGAGQWEESKAEERIPERLISRNLERLCAVEYRLRNTGDPIFVGGFIIPQGDRPPFSKTISVLESGPLDNDAVASLHVVVPRWRKRAATQRVVFVASQYPVDNTLSWLIDTTGNADPVNDPVKWQTIKDRVRRSGMAVLSIIHELSP